MKSHIRIFLFLAATVLITGCQDSLANDAAPLHNDMTFQASYLTDDVSRAELDHIMADAGVCEARRTVFWDHVTQFNQCEGMPDLPNGYHSISTAQPDYDIYAMQDAWNAAYPDFIGYNCRITAFSLMGESITVKNTDAPDTGTLFLDQEALQKDSSALFDDAELSRFLALFSTIEGENTDSSARQAELVRQAWENRGIAFEDELPLRLITVFFHNQYSETENELTVAHAGVLFDCGANGLYFVEKLAFQAPYRVVRFEDRSELKDYLMALYDIEWGQPTARPFLLENGNIL